MSANYLIVVILAPIVLVIALSEIERKAEHHREHPKRRHTRKGK